MPIDIRMPDGTIVTNVPDDVTPEQLRMLGEAYGATAPTPAPAAPTAPSATSSEINTERAAIESGRAKYTQQIAEAEAARAAAEEEVASRVGPRREGFFGNLSQYQGVTAQYDTKIDEARRELEDLQKREQFLAEKGRPAAQLSALETAGTTLAGIPRGAIRGVADIGATAGIFGEGGERFGRAIEAGGEALISGLGLEQSERTKEALQFDSTARGLSTFGEGLGSVVPFLGTSIAGASLKAIATASKLDKTAKAIGVGTGVTQAALGSGMGASEARDRMDAFEKETGEKLSPVSRRLITAGGGAIGLLETVTINTLLNKAPGPVKAAIQRRLDDVIKSAANQSALVAGVRQVTKEAVDQIESKAIGRMFTRGFVPEAVQESASQLLQNSLQRGAYDERQQFFEGVGESALLGGLVGKTVRGGAEAFGAATRKLNSINTAVGEELEAARDESEAPVTFNLRVRDLKDPSRQIIEQVEVLNMDGDMVSYRRADGRLGRMSLDEIDSRIVPESGYRAFATPEDFSVDVLRTRLDAAASNVEGADAGALDRYITGVTRKVSNAIAFGNPQEALKYISSLESRFAGTRGKKAKTTASPGDKAMQAVLEEARSVVTDYQVAYGKSQAQPGVEVGTVTPTEESAQRAREASKAALEESLRLKAEERAERKALLDEARTEPYNPDNPYGIFSWFDTKLRDSGYGGATTEEALALRDILRFESQLETADLSTEARRQRDVALERFATIESILVSNELPNNQKAAAIDAALNQEGRPSLTEEEARVVYGQIVAEEVFGAEGRMSKQRQAILNSVMLDDTVPMSDKAREFNARLEVTPELAGIPPTNEELTVLNSAPVETVEQVEEVPVREKPKRGAEAREAINQQIKVEQAKLDKQLKIMSGESTDPDDVAARRAAAEEVINARNAIKALKAEQAAIRAEAALEAQRAQTEREQDADAATTADARTPDIGRVEPSVSASSGRPTVQSQTAEQLELPFGGGVGASSPDVSDDTGGVTARQPALTEEAAPVEAAPEEAAPEEAAPVEEEPQAPEVQEEAVHSKLNESEKKRLAKHYGRKTYDAVAKSRFIQDFSNAVINGINSVAKAIRGIIRRIQKSVLAGAIVFSPAALTTDTPANFAVNLEAAQPSAEFAVTNQKFIPAEIIAVMSPAAQATYEALAPAAIASNRPFMIADKPNGRLLIFGRDGVFQQETVAIYGLQEGDVLPQARLDVRKPEELKLVEKPELRITPSGVFEFAVVDNPTYPGQKVLALTSPEKTRKVGIGERGGGGVFVALHGNTVTSAQRAAALKSGDAAQSKQSMGCIVTSPEFFTENIAPNIDEFAEAVIAVVPDTQTNLDAVLAASTALTPVPGSTMASLTAPETAVTEEAVPETAVTEEAAPALALGAMGAMGAMNVEQPGQRGAPRQVGRREEEMPAEPSLESRMPDNPNVSKPQMVGAIADIINWSTSKKSKITRKLNYKYQDAVDYAQALARSYGVSIESLPSNMSLDRKFELFESRKTGNQMELQRRFLRPIIDLMKELDVNPDDVGLFLWARSAKDRNALIATRNATMPDGGSGLTNDEAEAVKQFLAESQNGELMPKLEKIAKLHDKLVRHMLKLRVDSGLLTQQQADTALEQQPFYTPLKGYAEDGDMQLLGESELDGFGRYKKDVERNGDKKLKAAMRQLGTRKSEFFQAEGRTTIPLNPIFNLFADAQQVVMYAEKNRVGQTFLDNILDDPEGHADIARVYTDLDSRTMIKPSKDPAYPDGTPVNANIQREVQQGNALVVKKDGTPYYIEFAPTDAGDAMKRVFSNMTPAQASKWFQYFQNTATGLKSMLTRYNPIYLYGTAYLRDTQDAVLTAYVAQNMKGGPAEGKKIAEAMRKYLSPTLGKRRVPFTEKYVQSPAVSPLTGAIKNFISGRPPQTPDEARFMTALQEMIEEGGAVGHAMIASAETIAQEAKAELETYANMRKGGARKLGAGITNLRKGTAKALDATAQTIDLNARLATYLAAIENNLSKEDAARLALDSSLNLTRRGELAPILDTLLFFYSPTVESARKLVRMGTKGGAKYLRRIFYLGVLSAMWNSLFGDNDDDNDGRTNYQQVPSYIKQTRLVLFYGPGANDYVAIPMGFLLALPKYLGEVTTETALGVIKSPEEAGVLITDALGKVAAGAFNAASPIRGEVEDVPSAAQSLMPSMAKPLTDVFIFNRNYFGSPIYQSQSEFDNRLKSALGKPGTPEAYKKFASFMNEATFGSKYTSGFGDAQPEIWRYLFTQYTGGLGRIADQTLAKGIDPEKPLYQQIPVLNSFVGKGSEYGPMNDYYKLTGKGTPLEGKPAMEIVYKNYRGENSTVETALDILNAHYADAPHLFDKTLLDAYKLTEDRLDDIYKERKEMLERTSDPDVKRRIRNMYMEQASREQARFNLLYRAIEKEYR